MKKERWKSTLSLFLYFFRISWFTFGGGWSIVAQMQKDFVEQEKTITDEELLDIVSVGRSIPGTMIGNVAYLYGYRRAGILGGIAALAGMVTPPIIILSLLTLGYNRFKDNVYVEKMLTGVRAAVVPIIFTAVVKLCHGTMNTAFAVVVCVAACILSAAFDVNCVLIILLGVAVGLLRGERGEGRA